MSYQYITLYDENKDVLNSFNVTGQMNNGMSGAIEVIQFSEFEKLEKEIKELRDILENNIIGTF